MNNSNPSASSQNGSFPKSVGSAAEADALLCLLDLQPGMRVLDVGCGKAEFAIRLLDIYPSIEATGLEANAAKLAHARERAKSAGVADRLTLIESSPTTTSLTPDSFDAAVCIGAAQTFHSYSDAVRSLAALVRPGGLVLVADGYWQHDLALPTTTSFCPDHAGNVAVSEEAGLVPLYVIVNPDEAWDAGDVVYASAFDRYMASRPGDTDAPAARDHIRALCRMYLRMGQSMLGHGWYLLRKAM